MTMQQDLAQIEDAAREAQRTILKAMGSVHNHTLTAGLYARGPVADAANLVERSLATAQKLAAQAVSQAVRAAEQFERAEEIRAARMADRA
jgi:hypothetical protein